MAKRGPKRRTGFEHTTECSMASASRPIIQHWKDVPTHISRFECVKNFTLPSVDIRPNRGIGVQEISVALKAMIESGALKLDDPFSGLDAASLICSRAKRD